MGRSGREDPLHRPNEPGAESVSTIPPEPNRVGLGWPVWAALLLGVQASAYVLVSATVKPSDPGLRSFARGSLGKLQITADRSPAPPVRFQDAAGRPLRIADLPGEVKLVNVWATNCAPCVAEMPTLAALQRLEGPRVHVAAVSLDPVGRLDRARAFITKHPPLSFYSDPSYGAALALKAQGMPTTVIFDRDGRERARIAGAAEWDSPEARALIAALLDEGASGA